MADWIAAKSGGGADIPVAIEVPHGPVVESLMDRGFVVYAINPKQLDRFRDRYSPAGAKDDSLDARVLADALRTDLHRFRKIDPVDPVVIELREWSRITEELARDRVRLSNRVREQSVALLSADPRSGRHPPARQAAHCPALRRGVTAPPLTALTNGGESRGATLRASRQGADEGWRPPPSIPPEYARSVGDRGRGSRPSFVNAGKS